jgi:hypothetical protein
MSEQPRDTAGHNASEGLTGEVNVGKGLHSGQRGQELGSAVQMPAEGPPDPGSVSPPAGDAGSSTGGQAADE